MATVTGARGGIGAGLRSAAHALCRLARWAPTRWPWRTRVGRARSDDPADAQAWLGAEAYVNPPPVANDALVPPSRSDA